MEKSYKIKYYNVKKQKPTTLRQQQIIYEYTALILDLELEWYKKGEFTGGRYKKEIFHDPRRKIRNRIRRLAYKKI